MDPVLVAETLSALCWTAARATFSELGLTPEAFVERAPTAIARILMDNRAFDDAETDALWRPREELAGKSWGNLMDETDWWSECLAVFAVRRFAHEYARRWLPSNLETTARALRSDEWSPLQAVEFVRDCITPLDFARFGGVAQ